MPLWTKYNDRVRILQGWEVPLHCPHCGCDTVPRSESNGIDTKAVHKNPDDLPLLLSTMTCTECDHDLKDQASEKLTELFGDVPKKRGLPSLVMGLLFALPFVVVAIAWAGVFLGWWTDFGIWLYGGLAACGLVFLTGHYLIHPKMYSCECGNPHFLLMGAVGRSYCFRCSSCSRLRRRG
jgi:hypothetical protein